jgi:hypothetical protein
LDKVKFVLVAIKSCDSLKLMDKVKFMLLATKNYDGDMKACNKRFNDTFSWIFLSKRYGIFVWCHMGAAWGTHGNKIIKKCQNPFPPSSTPTKVFVFL